MFFFFSLYGDFNSPSGRQKNLEGLKLKLSKKKDY